MDREFDIKIYPWARVLQMADRGEIDGIPLLSRTDEREEYLIYSESVLEDVDLFWYSPDQYQKRHGSLFDWKDFGDLKGLRLGTVRGYGYTEDLWQASDDIGFLMEPVKESRLNFRKLLLGRLDIVPMGRIEALWVMAQEQVK